MERGPPTIPTHLLLTIHDVPINSSDSRIFDVQAESATWRKLANCHDCLGHPIKKAEASSGPAKQLHQRFSFCVTTYTSILGGRDEMATSASIFADMEGSVQNFNAPTSDKKEAEGSSNLRFHVMPIVHINIKWP
eukprot:scaffold3891_cov124-Skeletonema_dohrnii-CCMP3373.AAC.1